MLPSNDRQRAYLARGRRFRSTTPTELARLFVAGYDAWLATFPRRDRSVDDVQAELELRGEAPPFESVSKQIEQIAALTSELMGFADAPSGSGFMRA
ncbi:hypothetical protein OIU35_15155 [Boseaceae bacterium BT-24-1]|nr:hypothetical protein [Boseaceae bacterium BT-24-1]